MKKNLVLFTKEEFKATILALYTQRDLMAADNLSAADVQVLRAVKRAIKKLEKFERSLK